MKTMLATLLGLGMSNFSKSLNAFRMEKQFNSISKINRKSANGGSKKGTIPATQRDVTGAKAARQYAKRYNIWRA